MKYLEKMYKVSWTYKEVGFFRFFFERNIFTTVCKRSGYNYKYNADNISIDH